MMDEYNRGFIIGKHDEDLSLKEIAWQVPYSLRDVATTIAMHKGQMDCLHANIVTALICYGLEREDGTSIRVYSQFGLLGFNVDAILQGVLVTGGAVLINQGYKQVKFGYGELLRPYGVDGKNGTKNKRCC